VQSHAQAVAQFDGVVDVVVPGETQGYVGASAIIDVNGAVIREASE
jgi:tRNA A37 threonylcarbamoyladenosine synthetase subunit TsaC/SUA5/YrdC